MTPIRKTTAKVPGDILDHTAQTEASTGYSKIIQTRPLEEIAKLLDGDVIISDRVISMRKIYRITGIDRERGGACEGCE